jgi:hypothetical protein
MPPAAITGTRTASTTCGTRLIVPTLPSSAPVSSQLERCPPASEPCATIASTPAASSTRASATVVAIAITWMPAAWQRAVRSRPGSPSPTLNTGTRSSTITSKAPSIVSATSAGGSLFTGS